MKTTLRVATSIALFATTLLSAQQTLLHNGPTMQVSKSAVLTTTNNSNPAAREINPAPNVQMTTCTDKLTFVDRHPGTPDDLYIGGTTGFLIGLETYPGYTGQVTEAYASMKKYGATNASMDIYIYQLDATGMPSGSPLSSITVNVNSTGYMEYGGVLNMPATISANGFAVGVYPTAATDSAMVEALADPDQYDLSYLYDGTTLQTTSSWFSSYYDWLLRAKISYTAPTETATATPNTGCAGDPIAFNLSETGTPAWYSSVWASTNAATYSWAFGDAGTSTAAAPTHPYATSGTYTVTGTKSNPGWTTACPSAAATTTVTISGTAPSVSISASTNPVCPNGTSNFIATPMNGGNNPSYVWKKNGIQVGTGSTYSGSSWAANDLMTCEMVSNAACAPTSPVVSNVIQMYLEPISFSSYHYTATGLSVSFTATAANAVSWAWNFGDLGTSASSTPVHNYAAPGTYTVDLTVTNMCGQQTVSSINITVTSSGNSSGGNTGVLEQALEVNVNAFPNPVNNDLNVNYSINHPTDVKIEIMNTMGQVVSAQTIAATSTGTAHVSMENMAAGLYFVRFTAGENNVQTMRIVHQ